MRFIGVGCTGKGLRLVPQSKKQFFLMRIVTKTGYPARKPASFIPVAPVFRPLCKMIAVPSCINHKCFHTHLGGNIHFAQYPVARFLLHSSCYRIHLLSFVPGRYYASIHMFVPLRYGLIQCCMYWSHMRFRTFNGFSGINHPQCTVGFWSAAEVQFTLSPHISEFRIVAPTAG